MLVRNSATPMGCRDADESRYADGALPLQGREEAAPIRFGSESCADRAATKKKGAPACAGAPQRSGHCRVFARTEVADLVPWDRVPGDLSSCRRARRGR